MKEPFEDKGPGAENAATDTDKWAVIDELAENLEPAPQIQFRVAKLSTDDVLEALADGLRDFKKAPLYGLAFGAIYAVGGWCLLFMLLVLDLPFLVYPLAAGFALIAPFIACAFYTISDNLERQAPLSWGLMFRTLRLATRRDLGWMALVTGFSFFIWLDIAAVLFFGFFGLSGLGFMGLMNEVFTTSKGLIFLLIGNTAGAVIAMAVFSFSVTSFPMLYHRDVDFVTAMVTSVRVVRKNPRTMVFWAAIIAVTITLSLLSGLVALAVVLPILGHATWHLYRRAVSVSSAAR